MQDSFFSTTECDTMDAFKDRQQALSVGCWEQLQRLLPSDVVRQCQPLLNTLLGRMLADIYCMIFSVFHMKSNLKKKKKRGSSLSNRAQAPEHSSRLLTMRQDFALLEIHLPGMC